MHIINFFFIGVLAQCVYHFAIVPFAVFDIVGCAHDCDIKLSVAHAHVISIDEINVGEVAAVGNSVFDGNGFAVAEKHGSQMAVCVNVGKIARLIHIAAELCVGCLYWCSSAKSGISF